MKKIFVDTNIIIDLLIHRDPHYADALEIFSLADRKGIKLVTSAISIANAHYVVRKHGADFARSEIAKLRVLIDIVPATDEIIDKALEDKAFSDFEDAIQFYCAQSADAELILTRNLRDYKRKSPAAMTAGQYLSAL